MFLPCYVTKELWKNDLFMQALNSAKPEGAVWPGFILLVYCQTFKTSFRKIELLILNLKLIMVMCNIV